MCLWESRLKAETSLMIFLFSLYIIEGGGGVAQVSTGSRKKWLRYLITKINNGRFWFGNFDPSNGLKWVKGPGIAWMKKTKGAIRYLVLQRNFFYSIHTTIQVVLNFEHFPKPTCFLEGKKIHRGVSA